MRDRIRTLRSTFPGRPCRTITLLAWGIMTLAALIPGSGPARAIEPEHSIIPTVHPTLSPTSAIQVPLRFSADHTSVWRSDAEQRMLLTGHVYVAVGYRSLHADAAAVWLTPGKESGENTYDVAIYLSGNVEVREGDQKTATTTAGKELLVTTRVTQSALLSGPPPVSESEEQSALVKRGNEIRTALLNRPVAPMHIPTIVIVPSIEALQAGWIARGPNNRIIPGPGDLQVVRGPNGQIIPGAVPPAPVKPPRPRPNTFLTFDRVHNETLSDKESVTILEGAYFFFDTQDGRPPLEFWAQRMVLFSPKNAAGSQEAASLPASAPARAAASKPAKPAKPSGGEITKVVTAAYMEGDVTIEQGNQLTVRADRVFYELTTMRAIMLDAVLSAVDEQRNVPLYMRAAEIRQLSRGEFAAKKATFSTSEFYTPHYHIGASEVYLRDITPELSGPGGSEATGGAGGPGGAGGNAGPGGLDIGLGSGLGQSTYEVKAKDATIDVGGIPVFYWPYLSFDTSKNVIPLRTIRVSNSRTFGLSILTDWDLFALAGQPEPEGLRADLDVDYFGKRGPAGGVQAAWNTDDDHGILRTYALLDQGTDDLGTDRTGITPEHEARGRATVRDQRDLGDGLTLQVEGSYISDPNFLEQFFQREFDSDKEQETSLYLKKQGETDALTLLGKFSLFDFTATADQIDDQFTTEKKPELKYWRIGDSFLDAFTYYSENGLADVHSNITDYTPDQLGLNAKFLGVPAAQVPHNEKIRDYYRMLGWVDSDVVRADTRHELDMPLQLGDVKVVPYVTGRLTAWDDSFPDTNSGNTTRAYGSAGFRSSMQFWHVYNDVQSTFFDVHRLRHIIEPQFNAFVTTSTQDRRNLQPFDRDVEGITDASGTQLALNQKWQTKRGEPGHERDVDWIVLNVAWNQFYNKDKTDPTGPMYYPMQPVRGFYFASRPELSQATSSINVDGTWRIGERVRFLGEANYGIDSHHIEQAAAGIAVDQTAELSYFFGNRYIRALDTDEWTIAMDYRLTQKYQLIAAESYDMKVGNNILSSMTLVRRLPRFNMAITATYDANIGDTSVIFSMWPEGAPNTGFGNRTAGAADRR